MKQGYLACVILENSVQVGLLAIPGTTSFRGLYHAAMMSIGVLYPEIVVSILILNPTHSAVWAPPG
jgi:hypothetical protein